MSRKGCPSIRSGADLVERFPNRLGETSLAVDGRPIVVDYHDLCLRWADVREPLTASELTRLNDQCADEEATWDGSATPVQIGYRQRRQTMRTRAHPGDLSDPERLLQEHVAACQEGHGHCGHSQREMAALLRSTKGSVNASMRNLVKTGRLTLTVDPSNPQRRMIRVEW